MPVCRGCGDEVDQLVRGRCNVGVCRLPLEATRYRCVRCSGPVPEIQEGVCGACREAEANARVEPEAPPAREPCQQCGRRTRVMGRGLCFHCIAEQVRLEHALGVRSSQQAATLEVTGCPSCPFSSDRGDGVQVCTAIRSQLTGRAPVPTDPGVVATFCPLRELPISIRLTPGVMVDDYVPPARKPEPQGPSFWEHLREGEG